MRRRGREPGMLGNPILIGALTVLATIVAVTLAYQANNGLPFVPKYSLNLQIANASELTHGAEVHMGGALVGLVSKVDPVRDSAGRPVAQLDLKLNKEIQPLPVDSRFTVRLKGAIGLKYLDVVKGHSSRTYPNNATVPLTQSGSEVDLDQVLSMFNAPTRKGIQQTTIGFSDALVGRGSNINDAIGAFVPLVRDLYPVARNLSSPRTDLGGFFKGLQSFSSALVPVAQDQADLQVNLDRTFTALASIAVPYLQDWISQTPPTFNAVITDSPREQAFLTDTAGLFSELRPGFATLKQSAPVLADAFAAGARNLPGTIGLDRRLLKLSQRLATYAHTPAVNRGLDRLTLTAKSLHSPLRFLTPVQTRCNYISLFLRNIASLASDKVATGTVFRFVSIAIDDVLGGEGVPSQRPYTTPSFNNSKQHAPLHVNPYPNTASPGQPAECAAGNEPFNPTQPQIGNPPGNLGLHTEKTR